MNLANLTNKLPCIVTRFINSKYQINANQNRVNVCLYTGGSNVEQGEISVFDIDAELKCNDEKGIYRFSKKLNAQAFARADLSVKEIQEIESYPTSLYVERSKAIYNRKHCNIKPFPKNKVQAKLVATRLVAISKLKLREDFS